MGSAIFDSYSLLHISAGIVAYYWGFSFKWWFVFNIIYETFDNSFTMLINKIPKWPGGKSQKDSLINSFSDIIFSSLGWIFARLFDLNMDDIYTSQDKTFNQFLYSKKTGTAINQLTGMKKIFFK